MRSGQNIKMVSFEEAFQTQITAIKAALSNVLDGKQPNKWGEYSPTIVEGDLETSFTQLIWNGLIRFETFRSKMNDWVYSPKGALLLDAKYIYSKINELQEKCIDVPGFDEKYSSDEAKSNLSEKLKEPLDALQGLIELILERQAEAVNELVEPIFTTVGIEGLLGMAGTIMPKHIQLPDAMFINQFLNPENKTKESLYAYLGFALNELDQFKQYMGLADSSDYSSSYESDSESSLESDYDYESSTESSSEEGGFDLVKFNSSQKEEIDIPEDVSAMQAELDEFNSLKAEVGLMMNQPLPDFQVNDFQVEAQRSMEKQDGLEDDKIPMQDRVLKGVEYIAQLQNLMSSTMLREITFDTAKREMDLPERRLKAFAEALRKEKEGAERIEKEYIEARNSDLKNAEENFVVLSEEHGCLVSFKAKASEHDEKIDEKIINRLKEVKQALERADLTIDENKSLIALVKTEKEAYVQKIDHAQSVLAEGTQSVREKLKAVSAEVDARAARQVKAKTCTAKINTYLEERAKTYLWRDRFDSVLCGLLGFFNIKAKTEKAKRKDYASSLQSALSNHAEYNSPKTDRVLNGLFETGLKFNARSNDSDKNEYKKSFKQVLLSVKDDLKPKLK